MWSLQWDYIRSVMGVTGVDVICIRCHFDTRGFSGSFRFTPHLTSMFSSRFTNVLFWLPRRFLLVTRTLALHFGSRSSTTAAKSIFIFIYLLNILHASLPQPCLGHGAMRHPKLSVNIAGWMLSTAALICCQCFLPFLVQKKMCSVSQQGIKDQVASWANRGKLRNIILCWSAFVTIRYHTSHTHWSWISSNWAKACYYKCLLLLNL